MGDVDTNLIRAVDGRPRAVFAGAVFRHLGPQQSSLSGEGARIRGGRWNPPESFPTLYLGLSADTVVAEFYRLAERQGMPAENLLPRRFREYEVDLHALLDLGDSAVREALGLTDAIIASEEPFLCQSVGDAAHYVGFEGILAPSATGVGDVLVAFTDRLVTGAVIQPGSAELWEQLPTRPGEGE